MSLIKEFTVSVIASSESVSLPDLNASINTIRANLTSRSHLRFEPPLYRNNILDFNFENLTDEEKKMYYRVLALTLYAVEDSTQLDNNDFNVLSYHLPKDDNHITQEDLDEFNKLASYYSKKYRTEKLSYEQLLLKNRQIIGSKLYSKYYERLSHEKIFALLKERLTNLEKCSQDPIKPPEHKQYYRGEYQREQELLEQIPLPTFGEIADTIQWVASSFNIYDTGDFKENFEKFYDTILAKIGDNQYNIKSLATFLPITLFDVNENDKFTIKQEEFRLFLREQGGKHAPFQQFLLSFYSDLSRHFSNGFFELFINYSVIMDIRNSCFFL
jgi:hypothetical protein